MSLVLQQVGGGVGEHRARPVVGRPGEARAGGGGAGGQGHPTHRPQQSPLQVAAVVVVVVAVVTTLLQAGDRGRHGGAVPVLHQLRSNSGQEV